MVNLLLMLHTTTIRPINLRPAGDHDDDDDAEDFSSGGKKRGGGEVDLYHGVDLRGSLFLLLVLVRRDF